MIQDAAIRNLEVIGEAVKGLSEGTWDAAPEVPWRQIAAMRDRLIHGYFSVDADLVWQTIETELPPLSSEVERMLRR